MNQKSLVLLVAVLTLTVGIVIAKLALPTTPRLEPPSKPGLPVSDYRLSGPMMLSHQLEEGHSCPLTMTFAAVPSLRIQPELAAEWEPRVLSNEYDPRFIPANEKRGALFGMAMTERQGGSDVRANTTRAGPRAKRGPAKHI